MSEMGFFANDRSRSLMSRASSPNSSNSISPSRAVPKGAELNFLRKSTKNATVTHSSTPKCKLKMHPRMTGTPIIAPMASMDSFGGNTATAPPNTIAVRKSST